jgi:hypothetical protein
VNRKKKPVLQPAESNRTKQQTFSYSKANKDKASDIFSGMYEFLKKKEPSFFVG